MLLIISQSLLVFRDILSSYSLLVFITFFLIACTNHVDKQMVPQLDFIPDLLGNNTNKKEHVKSTSKQVINENINPQTVDTPKSSQGVTHAQTDLKIKRDGVKRKPLKGLRPNLPPKITKVNRGEKRPPPSTWDKSERKKKKKHDIVGDVSDYNLWRL